MTLEESQQQPPVTTAITPVRNEFTVKLVETSNTTAYNNLAKLISLSEYTDETGTTFRSRILTHKEIGQLKKLQKEEDFDKADFYVLENLIVAWRMKPRGFRPL